MVRKIKFSNDYNQKLDLYRLPPLLTYLKFGLMFNQKVDNLPSSIKLIFPKFKMFFWNNRLPEIIPGIDYRVNERIRVISYENEFV